MDYTRVEQRFRRYALVLQIVLLLSLAAYAVQQIWHMMGRDPPVEVTFQEWKGAGKWGMCLGGEHQQIFGVGMGLPTVPGRFEDILYEDVWTGWQVPVSAQKAHIGGGEYNCSVIDLTNWSMPGSPTSFALCIEGAANSVGRNAVEVNGEWQAFGYQSAGNYIEYHFKLLKEGWYYGYSSESREIAETVLDTRSTAQRDRAWYCPHWTRLTSSRSNLAAAMVIHVSAPHVQVSMRQGILPQLFDLGSKIGGYLSLLAVAFAAVFVKRYPNSLVANVFEERTLRGQSESGDPPRHQSSGEATGPLQTVMGIQGGTNWPARPPGIAVRSDAESGSLQMAASDGNMQQNEERKMPPPPWARFRDSE